MTVITEYRLKCDYCGNVSPVMDHRSDIPSGWQVKQVPARTPAESYSEFGAVASIYKDFCTPAHKEAWEKQQAGQTA